MLFQQPETGKQATKTTPSNQATHQPNTSNDQSIKLTIQQKLGVLTGAF